MYGVQRPRLCIATVQKRDCHFMVALLPCMPIGWSSLIFSYISWILQFLVRWEGRGDNSSGCLAIPRLHAVPSAHWQVYSHTISLPYHAALHTLSCTHVCALQPSYIQTWITMENMLISETILSWLAISLVPAVHIIRQLRHTGMSELQLWGHIMRYFLFAQRSSPYICVMGV